jgi:hypothetical protein
MSLVIIASPPKADQAISSDNLNVTCFVLSLETELPDVFPGKMFWPERPTLEQLYVFDFHFKVKMISHCL